MPVLPRSCGTWGVAQRGPDGPGRVGTRGCPRRERLRRFPCGLRVPGTGAAARGPRHSGGCVAVPALCLDPGRLYLSASILFLFASECGGGRCVCARGERGRALLPGHPSYHGARYTKPTAFIFKLGLKKKVDLTSCRMPLFVNPLPDAPVTSCYIML